MAPQVAAATDWPSVLDALQAHVECAEHLLARDPSLPVPAWAPPMGAGTLPPDQAERAAALLERMDALVARYERAAGAAHHEMDFVRAATAGAPVPRPRFIDASL